MVTQKQILDVVGWDKAWLFGHYMAGKPIEIIGNEIHYYDEYAKKFIEIHGDDIQCHKNDN